MSGTLAPLARQLISTEAAMKTASLTLGQTVASASTKSAINAAAASLSRGFAVPGMEAAMKVASLSLGRTLASASTKSAINAAAVSLSRGFAVPGMEAAMKAASLSLGQTVASASAKSAINAAAVSLSLTASFGGLDAMMKAALGSPSPLIGFAAFDTVMRDRGFGVVASKNRHIEGDLRSRQKSVDMAASALTGESIDAAKPQPETDKAVDGSGRQADQRLVDHLPAVGFFVMIALAVGGIGEAYAHGGWAEVEFATSAWIAVVLAYVSIWRSGGFAGRNR